MKTSFDLNTILFRLLEAHKPNMSGYIYKDERPDDSTTEDIVVNTIDLSQEFFPQLGTSNINIHVTDIDVNIAGRPQKKANSKRLEVLTNEVLTIVRNAEITGLKLIVESQNLLKDQEVAEQHYVNIRIAWVIHE